MRTSSQFLLEKLNIVEKIYNRIDCSSEVLDVIMPHSWRVMFMTSQLGKCLKVEENDTLTLAALLHDVGKLGISKEILFKPSALTSTEYIIIHSHSHMGNIIARNIFNQAEAAVFIRDHHERFDGKGYPRGLKGEDISLEGRIIAIVDSFDAMVFEKRNYSKNKTINKAITELEKHSWSQFDGYIVKEFITLWENNTLSNNIIREVEAVINNWLQIITERSLSRLSKGATITQ
ncbi:MAG: HD domain-containing protein [Firmicutes bacterium]|nr:HD domain-containing protein [Bacillota bacterium]